MANVVAMKFSYHDELRSRLITTGDALLVEGNTWGDTFWGQCDGVGENHLGRILMGVRLALTEEHSRLMSCSGHEWVIEPAGVLPGTRSYGECKNCKGVRYYNNVEPDVDWN